MSGVIFLYLLYEKGDVVRHMYSMLPFNLWPFVLNLGIMTRSCELGRMRRKRTYYKHVRYVVFSAAPPRPTVPPARILVYVIDYALITIGTNTGVARD